MAQIIYRQDIDSLGMAGYRIQIEHRWDRKRPQMRYRQDTNGLQVGRRWDTDREHTGYEQEKDAGQIGHRWDADEHGSKPSHTSNVDKIQL